MAFGLGEPLEPLELLVVLGVLGKILRVLGVLGSRGSRGFSGRPQAGPENCGVFPFTFRDSSKKVHTK